MNDLADKALQGLDAVVRSIARRPAAAFAVSGFALAVVVVVAGARVAAERIRPLTTWFGLQDARSASADTAAPAAVLLAGVLALVLLWLAAVQFVRRARPPVRQVWCVAGAWAAPFAVGPPLLSGSVYSYVAYGALQRAGHDPYVAGPALLGNARILDAVDPAARNLPSAAGPLGTVLEHLSVSVSGGSALGAVVVLRIVAVVALAWIGRTAAELARDRAQAVSLTVLNPLALLYLVSAARLDALTIAVSLAALQAARRRRWLVAVAAACVAGSVTAQGFALVPVVIAAHTLGDSARGPAAERRPAWWWAGRDALVAAAVTAALGLAVRDGFGWLATAGRQFAAHTAYSAAGALSAVLTPIVAGASYDDLAIGGRVTANVAMVCALAYLVVSIRARPVQHTAAFALLAVGLLAPALYPWYLLWGVLCLAPVAAGWRRTAVLAVSAGGCLLAPVGFSDSVGNAIVAAWLTAVAAAVLLVHRTAQQAGSATAGDLADGRADVGQVDGRDDGGGQ